MVLGKLDIRMHKNEIGPLSYTINDSTLHSNHQCVSFFPKPHDNSLIPTGCPTIQLNSDAIYPDIASDSTS